jgi:hypothetical protein
MISASDTVLALTPPSPYRNNDTAHSSDIFPTSIGMDPSIPSSSNFDDINSFAQLDPGFDWVREYYEEPLPLHFEIADVALGELGFSTSGARFCGILGC